eukprot:1192362-Prorocentrum_minimum.AAC.3
MHKSNNGQSIEADNRLTKSSTGSLTAICTQWRQMGLDGWNVPVPIVLWHVTPTPGGGCRLETVGS